MGARERLILWFAELDAVERQGVIALMNQAERQQIDGLLRSLSDVQRATIAMSEKAEFERIRKQLQQAPLLFRQVLAENEVQGPPSLIQAVRAEIDGLAAKAPATQESDSDRPWFEIDSELLKQLWHRFLRIFK